MPALTEAADGLPNLCGAEDAIADAIARGRDAPVFLPESDIAFDRIRAATSIALHMHQPLVPAGGDDLATAALIGNLQAMEEHPGVGDNHNAPVFRRCYARMGDFVPELLAEGRSPRVMLEYSGTLLWGLERAGATDVLDRLRTITCDPACRRAVEWLGAPWGHAVAPSTPVQDFRLHVRAWQHHFAALFGLEALARVRGFSPSEMALPNHPDVAYEFVRTLVDCGYRWVLVQEHTVEEPATGSITAAAAPAAPAGLPQCRRRGRQHRRTGQDPGLGHQARRADAAVLRGQGTRAAGAGRHRRAAAGHADRRRRERRRDDERVPGQVLRGEHLAAAGVADAALPEVQPVFQRRIWERMQPGDGPARLREVIAALEREDGRFHMEGGSWTANLSWTRGYDNVLGPMEEASARFHEVVLAPGRPLDETRCRNALTHLLASQTSCYRYWGQGLWTDYGRELCRRTTEILKHDF